MYRTLSLFVGQCIFAVATAFLILWATGLGEFLAIDMQSSSLWVAGVLAVLVLIHPKLSRLAFVERLNAEIDKLNIKS